MYAAKLYKMDHLEYHCSKHLSRILGTKNVCHFTNEAINFDAANLLNACQQHFSLETLDIILQPSFLELSQPALSAILDVEIANVDECRLFKSVFLWMKNNCAKLRLNESGQNLRRVAGETFYKIRFPVMTVSEFSKISVVKGLFTDKEMSQIFQKISMPRSRAVECPFSHIKRDKPSKAYRQAVADHYNDIDDIFCCLCIKC